MCIILFGVSIRERITEQKMLKERIAYNYLTIISIFVDIARIPERFEKQ